MKELNQLSNSILQEIRKESKDPLEVKKALLELKRRGVLPGSRRFLQHFEGSKRGSISSYFLGIARKRRSIEAKEIVLLVEKRRKEKLREAEEWDKWGDTKKRIRHILEMLKRHRREAEEFAVWTKAFLELPVEEQKRVREVAKLKYTKQREEKEPATGKQKYILKQLGYIEEVENKRDARELIKKLKEKSL